MDQVFFEKLTDACHTILSENKQICTYLKNRGITENTINEFKLGAFPRDLRILYKYIHPEELLKKSIIYRADKSPFSKYPLVIPIRDAMGKPVAIGCRTLMPEEERKKAGIPKYRNSVYHKTAYLFGLDRAIPHIRKFNKVYVVEGYFDSISAVQSGFNNVVATCGTLFSQRQLMVLSRYTDNICILFDNDEPGQNNAKSILNKFSNNGLVSISCSHIPPGFKDLDEYLVAGGSLDIFNKWEKYA